MAIGSALRRVRGGLALVTRAALAVAVLDVAVVAATGPAKADMFDFSYSGSGVSAMGTFTATLKAPGQYTITGITGERNNLPITQLLGPDGYGSNTNNNILYFPATVTPGANNPSYIDTHGFAYTVGASDYNPYFNGFNYDEAANGRFIGSPLTSFTVTEVPAPIPGGGLLSFVALGLAGLLYLGRSITGFARFEAKPSMEP